MPLATRTALAPLAALVFAALAYAAHRLARRGAAVLLAALALTSLGGLAGCGGKLSDNADLESLGLSSGTLTPAFAPATFLYTASVDNAVTSIVVTPRSADAGASVTVRGGKVERGTGSPAIPLTVGINSITIVVTSEDDSVERTYVVRVIRRTVGASSDASLTDLLLSAGTLDPVFSAAVTAYTATVANTVASVTVTPFSGFSPSSLKVNGTSVTDGQPSAAQALNVGTNPITVEVISQDASTQRTYTITVTRAAP